MADSSTREMRDSVSPPSVPEPPSPWKRRGATLFSLAVSATLLAALYRSVDLRLIVGELRDVDATWLVLSVSLIVPITVLRAIRFFLVVPRGTLPSVAEALRLTLVASAANVFMPAKSGDLVKSYFVAKERGTSAGISVAVVVYERLCDLFGLITWCAVGWLVSRPVAAVVPSAFWILLAVLGGVCAVLIASQTVARMLGDVCSSLLGARLARIRALVEGWPGLLERLGGRRAGVIFLSLLLWLVHVIQIWLFTVALSARIPFAVSASLSAVALMIGQLPFTFAGLGARDMALVVLMRAYVRPESAAALGLLISTRNLLPPLAALPIMRPYVAALAGEVGLGTRRSPAAGEA